jgi:hypothetical protein
LANECPNCGKNIVESIYQSFDVDDTVKKTWTIYWKINHQLSGFINKYNSIYKNLLYIYIYKLKKNIINIVMCLYFD